jgi:hypothetical protein
LTGWSSTTSTRRHAGRRRTARPVRWRPRPSPAVSAVAAERREDLDGEGRALPFHALDQDLAAHQLDQAAGDVEAQPRAAERAGGRGVGLGEGPEQLGQRGLAHADAGVGHLQADALTAGNQVGSAGQDHLDLAAIGELQGVGHQVGQALAQAHRVEQQHRPGGMPSTRNVSSMPLSRAVG